MPSLLNNQRKIFFQSVHFRSIELIIEMQTLQYLWLYLTVVIAGAQNIALFWNLYEAVATGSRILHDVTEGVGAVSKAIRAIDAFLDSSAQAQIKEALSNAESSDIETESSVIEEKVEDANIPTFSGCGALGFHIRDEKLPMNELTSCCNSHDLCYNESCRMNKRECDGKLKYCLFGVCDNKSMERTLQKNCRGAAKLLFSGTMALSFQQYNDAMTRLSCPRKEEKRGRRRGRWT